MKMLTVDIETSPNLADVWSLWQQNVSLAQLRETSYVLCWAAKWHGQREVMTGAEWDDGEDYLKPIYDLLDETDVIITFNGDHFDIPTLNKEFVLRSWSPPSTFQSIDLLKAVKKRFRFPSNKLDHVSQELGVGSKIKHEGHGLWTKVMAGDKKAQARMLRYCQGDVRLTEKLHDRILPWIPGYPNRWMYDSVDGCPTCGVGLLVKRGFYYAATGRYQTYRCGSCGAYCRDTRRTDGVDVRGL